MRIDQLPVASAIGNTDTLPFNNDGLSKQISVGNLTNSIRDDVYGAPLTASTSSAMTDTSRIYVYTGTTGGGFTNGHWYYYNGSAWTDGGIYNSIAVQTDPTLTLEGVPADAKATGELKTVIDDKLAEFDVAVETFYPTASGEGALVTIEGTVDAPPAEMVIYGKSVQSGTPSPSSPAAIVTAGSGGTLPMVSAGKNLIPFTYGTPQTVNGITFTPNPDGTVTVSGTNTGSGNADFNVFRSAISGFLPNGTYRVSGFPTDGTGLSACVLTVRTNDKSGGNANYTSITASGRTFACRDSDTITSIYISITPGTAVNAIYRPMLNVGTSTEAYAPPGVAAAIGTTPNGLPGIPVASGGNYTDTGGQQWICDTIDLEAGTWTKRCGVVTLDGSMPSDWRKESTTSDNYRFAYPKLVDVIQRTNNDSYAPLLCSHYPVVSANGSWGIGSRNGIAVADNGGMYITDADLNTSSSTVADLMAKFSAHTMTVVYALAVPVVNQLTDAQIAALRALRGRKGLTNLYSADPAGPEFRAEMYIDIPTYIQSVIKKPLSLYDLNITPGTWNNIHPDFDPETEEYAVTLRKGNAATVNAVVIGTTATIAFGTIGGARTYFTMRTSSSAVGDRKTYSCEVNPYDAGVGGGLVMTVTKGNLFRRYYLSITSVE